MLSNQMAKEKILWYFFGKMTIEKFESLCENFSNEALPALVRSKALREIKVLQEKGFEVVVVSASPENWVKRWCDTMGIQCIASKLVVKNNRLTGRLSGKNCHGNEKVFRIKEKYELSAYEKIYSYGDTSGDKPMLQLAHISFYKPFR